MSDKKISPREAAIQVLKKAEELYKASTLAKAESKHDRCVEDVKRNSPDVKNAHAVCVAEGVKPAKWGKSEDGVNPDEKADAALGEQVEQDVHEHEAHNEDPAHAEAPMKGHIKLAKFMGRMEHKRGQKSKEMDKMDGMAPPPAAPAPAAPAPAMPPMAMSKNKV
jgi:hypothetical protein